MPLVLLTGANGFIAAHMLELLLRKDYHVRATARSQSKCDVIRKQYPTDALELVVVEDFMKAAAFDEAVKGVDYILHTASPLRTDAIGLDMMLPAVNGTKSILRSAATQPQLRKIVYTSSFGAIVDQAKEPWPGHVYTDDQWSPLTWEDGIAGPQASSYRVSKKYAELELWDFKRNQKPSFDVAAICPPLVFGPIINDQTLDTMNTSNQVIWKYLSGQTAEVGDLARGFADVRDVAQAHLLAMEAKGSERYIVTAGLFTEQSMANILRQRFPHLQASIPVGDPSKAPLPTLEKHFQTDASKSRKLGVTYRDFEACLVEAAESLIAMAKREGKM